MLYHHMLAARFSFSIFTTITKIIMEELDFFPSCEVSYFLSLLGT